MNSDSLNMVSRLGEGHMPCTFFLSEPQLKTTVVCTKVWQLLFQDSGKTIHSAEKNDTSYKRAAFFTEMKQKKNQNGRLRKSELICTQLYY